MVFLIFPDINIFKVHYLQETLHEKGEDVHNLRKKLVINLLSKC